MVKEHVTIKPSLSLEDRIAMPQELAAGYFTTKENGEVLYTPYYADMTLASVFFLHCVEGLTFEVRETGDGQTEIAENIYESVTKDKELMQLYEEFLSVEDLKDCPYRETVVQMRIILSDAESMADFRKQQLIHQNRDALNTLLLSLAEKIQELDPENLDLSEALNALPTLTPAASPESK